MKVAEAQAQFNQGKLIVLGEYRHFEKREVKYTKGNQSGQFTVIEHRVEIDGTPYQFEELLPKGSDSAKYGAPAVRGQPVAVLLRLEPQQPRGYRVTANVQVIEK